MKENVIYISLKFKNLVLRVTLIVLQSDNYVMNILLIKILSHGCMDFIEYQYIFLALGSRYDYKLQHFQAFTTEISR